MRKFTQFLRALCGSNRGVTAIEFALVSPVLLTIMVGIVDIGAVIRDKIELNNAAATAARYVLHEDYSENNLISVATSGSALDPADITAAVESVCGCAGGVAATCGDVCPDTQPAATYMVITLSKTNQMVIPYPGFSDMAISGQSRMRLD